MLLFNVTAAIEDFVSCNYEAMITAVTESMKSRSPMLISIIGRINVIKMNALFLYLFQSVPRPHHHSSFSSFGITEGQGCNNHIFM